MTTFIPMSFKEIERTHSLLFTPNYTKQSLTDLRTDSVTTPMKLGAHLTEDKNYDEN